MRNHREILRRLVFTPHASLDRCRSDLHLCLHLWPLVRPNGLAHPRRSTQLVVPFKGGRFGHVYELDEQFRRRKLSLNLVTTPTLKSALCADRNDRVVPFFLRSQGLISPPLVQKTGYGAFLFFAAFGCSSGLWVWYFVPETKQVPSVYLLRFEEGLELISHFLFHALRLVRLHSRLERGASK